MGNNYLALVAVGVPVYNGEKYLRECLDSILAQTYSNWECIISINLSEDNSLKIAKEYAHKDSRFKIYEVKEFCALVENWNNTFVYSNQNAKYFKIVQADDWIYKEYLEKMVEMFEINSDIGLVSSYRIANKKVLPRDYNIYDQEVKNGADILYKQLTKQIDYMGTITTVMFRMKHLKELDNFPKIFDESSFHIDMELDYKILKNTNMGFVPQILSYTRRHEESGTTTIVNKVKTIFQHDEKVYFDYLKEFPDLKIWYKKLRLKYASFYMFNIIYRRKKVLKWHRKYLIRPFTLQEYVLGVLFYNIVTLVLNKIITKSKNILMLNLKINTNVKKNQKIYKT